MLAGSHFFRKFLNLNIGKYLFKGIRNRVFGKNLTGLGSGASTLKESTMSFFFDLGVDDWANFYALTETYVPTVVTGLYDRYCVGTVGRTNRFDDIDVIIHEPDENGIGEIRIKTIMIMKGYFREPELTAAAFDEEGYFKTGDLGYIDKKSFLHVMGRIKEAILMHSGKKVAPSDVDNHYDAVCPDVTIASCGVPCGDGHYDEIHLFVEKGELLENEQQNLKKKIMEFSSQTSDLYQISAIHFIDTIPMTSIKKVKRFQLKEIALAGLPGR